MFNKILNRSNIYLRLMRFNQPIGIFLLLWPTLIALWISSSGNPSIKLIFIFTLGTIIMRSVGCIVNDYADINFDKYVKRTKLRPLTNNEVKKKEAIYLILFLLFLAFLCLIPLNSYTFKLSIIALFFALLYPFTKRYFNIPQIFLGIAFSFGILMTYSENIEYLPIDCWILFIANLFWVVAYDTIYAILDKEDDEKISIYSSAITFGKYDTLFIFIFYAIFDLLLILLAFIIHANICFYMAIFIVIYLEISICYKIKCKDKVKCFESFLNNNYIGLILFIGIVLNYLF